MTIQQKIDYLYDNMEITISALKLEVLMTNFSQEVEILISNIDIIYCETKSLKLKKQAYKATSPISGVNLQYYYIMVKNYNLALQAKEYKNYDKFKRAFKKMQLPLNKVA